MDLYTCLDNGDVKALLFGLLGLLGAALLTSWIHFARMDAKERRSHRSRRSCVAANVVRDKPCTQNGRAVYWVCPHFFLEAQERVVGDLRLLSRGGFVMALPADPQDERVHTWNDALKHDRWVKACAEEGHPRLELPRSDCFPHERDALHEETYLFRARKRAKVARVPCHATSTALRYAFV